MGMEPGTGVRGGTGKLEETILFPVDSGGGGPGLRCWGEGGNGTCCCTGRGGGGGIELLYAGLGETGAICWLETLVGMNPPLVIGGVGNVD